MSAPVTDPFGLVGATLEGRFAIDRVVARGGFGVVYQGRHLRLKKAIALKVLFVPDELSAVDRKAFLESFTLEAQTIAALEHPAIVRVFDFGVSRGRDGRELPWMVLEWIEGQSLGEWFEARGRHPVEPRAALELLRPVFHALAFAHTNQVAHRDIKPSNIMVIDARRGSGAGLVGTRLLDFGIAKVMTPEETVGTGNTRTRALLSAFSLPYASPEQKSGTKTGPWTDVHALGLVLTELLTGSKPYPSTDRLEVEQMISLPTRPTPSHFGVDVGPWEEAIACAVAFKPAERFQNAGAFLTALEATVGSVWRIERNVRSSTEPAFGANPASTKVVSPSTITDAATTSDAPPPPRRGRAGVWVAGGVAAAVIAAGAVWRGVAPEPAAHLMHGGEASTPPTPDVETTIHRVTPTAPPRPPPDAPAVAEAMPAARLDARPPTCTSDEACSDHAFCNGVERCLPGARGADARGCVSAGRRTTCPAGTTCSEARRRCVIEQF